VDSPGVTGSGEHASSFGHGLGELDDGSILASDRDLLDFADALPECFNGIIQGLNGGNASAIVFEFGTCDGAVCGAQVIEHGSYGELSKAKDVVIKSGKVDEVESGNDPFFDLFGHGGGNGELLQCGIIESCDFGTSSTIGAGNVLGSRPGWAGS